MPRIFKENNIDATGKVLPIEDFELFCDMDSKVLQKKKLDEIVKIAETYLDKDVPPLTLSMYRDFELTGSRINFQGPFHERRDMAFALALAESYERKGRFVDKLCDVIWAIMEESTWIVPAHARFMKEEPGLGIPDVYNDRMLHGIDLFSAVCSGVLTAVYYLCSDILDKVSPLINKKLKHTVLNRSVRPYLTSTFFWEGEAGNKVNNWCPWILSNILFVTAVLEDDSYKREAVVKKALKHLDNFTAFYGIDGGCDEGPFYWEHAGGAYFDCLELIYDMTGGKINVYNNETVKAIGEYIAKFNIDKDKFITFADSHGKILHDGCLLSRYGKKTGSKMLENFGVMMQELYTPTVEKSFSLYRHIKFYMTEKAEFKKTTAVKNTYLRDIQVAIFRENEDTSCGMFLAMKGGHNDESHNHNDVGSFIVYNNGKPVLIDTGVGPYTKQTFSDHRYELWFMRSCYHNLPSFDGFDEHEGRKYTSTNVVYDEENRSLSMNIEKAFDERAGVRFYERTCSLKNNTVTVKENISLDNEKEIIFNFMCCNAPSIKQKGVVSLPEGCELRYGEEFDCKIEVIDSSGMDTVADWDTESIYRIQLITHAKDLNTEITVVGGKR